MRLKREAGRLSCWLVMATAAAVGLLLPAPASAAQFLGGPSVRVTANTSIEFKWTTDVPWYGKVEIFTSPDGTPDTLIATKKFEEDAGGTVAATQPDVSMQVASVIQPDTTYYFRITAWDPTGSTGDLIAAAPLPSFFTGAQALNNVQVVPSTTGAVISWQGNVVGLGHIDYGQTTSYGLTVDDTQNVTDHSLTLTGLQPATTYDFHICNRHAIDGDCLASSTGSFTTLALFTDQFLQPLDQSTNPANPVLNTGKNGRVIQVKAQISQGGTALTSLNAPGAVTIAVSKLAACSSTAGSDPVESYADAGQSSAGTNQFHYDATAQAWTYGLDTKALGLVTGNCYRIDVSVNGSKITNAFAVFQPTK